MFSYQPWTRDGFDAGLRMISIRTIAGNDGFMAPSPSRSDVLFHLRASGLGNSFPGGIAQVGFMVVIFSSYF